MSGRQGKFHPSVATMDGYQPLQKGFTPKDGPRPINPQGGYQPTTGQRTSTAPASVPNQPSSVQAPKK